MNPIYYIYIVLGVSFISYVGLLTIRIVKGKKRKKQEAAVNEEKVKNNLNEVDDVRYTMEENPVNVTETINDQGIAVSEESVNATFLQKDYILAQNTPVEVAPDGELKPGKYIVLSTDENQDRFNIRVGIYVREYHHNQEIVLADGDTVCAVSSSVILR